GKVTELGVPDPKATLARAVAATDTTVAVEYDGELLAHISRRWLRVRDTYAVDVVREDADAALLIAVAVCVIRMAERED
ncbi:hypothetical protein ACWDOU_23335, partial [Streptomyces hydrogenans]